MKLSLKPCLIVLTFALFPSIANADGPPVKQWAHERVNEGLVKPLAQHESERSRFSRAAMPPRERRLRILQTSVSRDKQGREFVRYEVDARFGDEWHSELAGCVYTKSGNILVQRGEEYRPADFLLGKNVKAVPGACESAPSSDRA